MILDDVEINRKIACRALSKSGYKTLECEDGYEAISILKEQKIDLVITDLSMPLISGQDTISLIRTLPGTAASLPIAALSANITAEARIKLQSLGVRVFIEKPYRLNQLVDTVDTILSTRQDSPPPT